MTAPDPTTQWLSVAPPMRAVGLTRLPHHDLRVQSVAEAKSCGNQVWNADDDGHRQSSSRKAAEDPRIYIFALKRLSTVPTSLQ